MSFTGGKLRLKGDDRILKKKKKKKKKKVKEKDLPETQTEDLLPEGGGRKEGREEESDERLLASTSGYFIKDEGPVDRRTKAEKRFDEVMKQREREEIVLAAGKTHRDKVKEFNEKLANMSEHYDIPKVGPG